MNGSTKQVNWAEDIKEKMVNKIDAMRRQFAAECSQHGVSSDDVAYQAGMKTFARAIAYVNARTEARWFIDNREKEITRQWVKEMGK